MILHSSFSILPLLAAEVTDFSPPVQIGLWLACACFTLWFLLLVDRAVQRVRGKAPEPPNSQLESDHKDIKRRVKALEDWRNDLIKKLDDDKYEIISAGERRESKLTREIQAATDRIDSLQDTVAQIPNEFMTLLANAKNILGGTKHD